VSDGYQVVMAEVLSLSRVFAAESGTVAGTVAGGGPSAAGGGDAVVDAALADALQVAAVTTGQLAAVIDSHAGKLRTAYERYQGAEETNTQLCRQLTKLISGA
jgi:hypothetical protein